MRTIITKESELMNLKGAVKTIKEVEKGYRNITHYHFDKNGNLLVKDRVDSRTKDVYTYNEKNHLIKSQFFQPYEWLVYETRYELNEDTYEVKIGFTDVEKKQKEEVHYDSLVKEVPRMLENEIIENFKQDLKDYKEDKCEETKVYDSPKIQKFLAHEYVGNFRDYTIKKYFKTNKYGALLNEILTFNKDGMQISMDAYTMTGYLTDSKYYNFNSVKEFETFFKKRTSNGNEIPFSFEVFDEKGNIIIRKWNRKRYTEYEDFHNYEYVYDVKGNWIKKVEIDSFQSTSLERELEYFE